MWPTEWRSDRSAGVGPLRYRLAECHQKELSSDEVPCLNRNRHSRLCSIASWRVQLTEANVAVEVLFLAERDYGNPFLDVTLEMVVTDPGGTQKTIPGFWAGNNRWKVRYASPRVGLHRYRTQCSKVDAELVPAIVGAWGRADCDAMKHVGVDGLKRHWRYLVARYSAIPCSGSWEENWRMTRSGARDRGARYDSSTNPAARSTIGKEPWSRISSAMFPIPRSTSIRPPADALTRAW